MANEISKFPVPLILKKILKDKLSGRLIVTRKDSKRELFFVNSRLEFATSTVENESLGDVLLEAGKIDKEQLRLALEIRSNVPTKMGEILAKTCDLSMREIYDGLVQQVTKIAAATFPLKEGEWRFIKKKPDIPNPQNMKIKLQEVMREGIKKLEDVAYYRKRFYYRSPVTIESTETVGKFLTSEETDLYEKLSHFSNISVKNIMAALNLPEPIFWRIIILFYLLNIADFVEFTVDDEEQNKKIAKIDDMYQKIKSGQSDYFQLLESDKVKTVEEADKRFGEFTDEFSPEKLHLPPDSSAMRRAKEVYQEVQFAHTAVRLDLEKKIDKKEESGTPLVVGNEEEHPIELDSGEKIELPPEFKVDLEDEPLLELNSDDKIQPPPDIDIEPQAETPLPLGADEFIGEPDEIRGEFDHVIPVDLSASEEVILPPVPGKKSEEPAVPGEDKDVPVPPPAEMKKENEPPAQAGADSDSREPEKPKVTKSDMIKQAREFFTTANHLHNQKKYFEAANLLRKAVEIDNSKANYFMLLGLCQSKMPTTKKLAEKNLKTAARMEPWNADPMFALGQLYKSENLVKKAKEYFEKALEINMEHTLAGKAMDEFSGLGADKKSLFSLFGKKK